MTEIAYVYGQRWGRGNHVETIDREIPVAFFNEFFATRLLQLGIGDAKDHATVHSNEPLIPEDRKEEWQRLADHLNQLCEWNSIRWEISCPMRELSKEEIEDWFSVGEFAACAEDSAIGVSTRRRKTAGKLFYSVAPWIESFDDDDDYEIVKPKVKVKVKIEVENEKPRAVRLEN